MNQHSDIKECWQHCPIDPALGYTEVFAQSQSWFAKVSYSPSLPLGLLALVDPNLSWGVRQAIHRNALRATFTFGKSGVFACWGCPPNPLSTGLLKGKISQQEVPGYSPTCSALRAIAATANNPVKNE
jgi:hypothetical protein